jgi:dipeptidyl aminopeptidase/acylaminoacyl peptidase
VILTHGENDWRVPVTESRRFVEKARGLGKRVAYVEFPGQGHGIDGLANNLTYYQALFDFYESLGAGAERRPAPR